MEEESARFSLVFFVLLLLFRLGILQNLVYFLLTLLLLPNLLIGQNQACAVLIGQKGLQLPPLELSLLALRVDHEHDVPRCSRHYSGYRPRKLNATIRFISP